MSRWGFDQGMKGMMEKGKLKLGVQLFPLTSLFRALHTKQLTESQAGLVLWQQSKQDQCCSFTSGYKCGGRGHLFLVFLVLLMARDCKSLHNDSVSCSYWYECSQNAPMGKQAPKIHFLLSKTIPNFLFCVWKLSVFHLILNVQQKW